MHRSAANGHVDVCNLLLNTKGINMNSVDEVSIHYTCDVCVYVIVCYVVLFNKAVLLFIIIFMYLFILIVDI